MKKPMYRLRLGAATLVVVFASSCGGGGVNTGADAGATINGTVDAVTAGIVAKTTTTTSISTPVVTSSPTPTTTVPTGGVSALNDCVNFVDRTAVQDVRTLAWDFGVSNKPERCMKIQAGQTVSFSGSFIFHPLAAEGGDTPSPFDTVVSSGLSANERFNAAGTYGFICQNHSSMKGVIQVVP